MSPLIRPHYHGGEFAGFAVWVFNLHLADYEAVGRPFSQYKHAALAWFAITS